MPYVERDDTTGEIVGLFARPQHDGQELLIDDDPVVMAFRTPPPEPAPPLTAEDIWRVLEAKGLVTPGDVPPGRRPPPRGETP